MCSSEKTELDTLLKKIMDPNTQSELLDKPKLLTTSKRPRNKRKLNQAKPPVKPSYNPPVAEKSSIDNENDTVVKNKPAPKMRKINVSTNTQNKYISPKQAPKYIKEPNSNNKIKTGYRRSPRVPRVTTKYLESIKAELKDSGDDK